MRVLATIVALALALFAANAAYAGASMPVADCMHEMAGAAGGHGDHHGSKPAPAPAGHAICCVLHCATFATAPLPGIARVAGSASLSAGVAERFTGTSIEPAIPPPRS